mgnify:CR=1 FL=1
MIPEFDDDLLGLVGWCWFVCINMINSQAISLTQKQKMWREQKEEKFKDMAGDRCSIFNYFFNNNDIFHYID